MRRAASIWISYLEIYNENVNDLLDSSKKNLPIREDKTKGEVQIEGLSRFCVQDLGELIYYLQKGNEIKTIAEHKMN